MVRKPRILSLTWIALFLGLVGWISSAPALTVDDVLDLLDAGVGEDVLVEQMEADGSVFHLTAEDILYLKDAGASDDLISYMIATGEGRESRDTSYDRYSLREYDRYRTYTVSIYYDPFGYYWYPCPYYFTYWAPFTWFDYGFYWGGPVWWGWAHWGPRYHYYAHTIGYYWYPHRYRPHHGYRHDDRRLWSRSHSRARDNYVVSRKTPRASGVSYTRAVDRGRTSRDGAWSRGSKTVRGRYALGATRTPRSRSSTWSTRSRGTPKTSRYGLTKQRSTWSRSTKKGTRSGTTLSPRSGTSKKSRAVTKAPSRSAQKPRPKSTRAGSSGRQSGSRGSKTPRSRGR